MEGKRVHCIGLALSELLLVAALSAPKGALAFLTTRLGHPSALSSATLYPVADAYTDSSQSGLNFGTQSSLMIEGGGLIAPSNRHTYLQFDLSGIPTNAIVTLAEIELCLSSSSGTQPFVVDLFSVPQSWTETAITWANQPTGDAWFCTLAVTSPAGYKTWNVTTLVHQWVDVGRPNHGLVLVYGGSQWFQLILNSREAGSSRPRLVITYEVPATPTATQTMSPSPTTTSTSTSTATRSPTATSTPTETPTATATGSPTMTPSLTSSPTEIPAATPSATASPTNSPTVTPSRTARPSETPTSSPTEMPSATPSPTARPSATPSGTPTALPDLIVTDVWAEGSRIEYQIQNTGEGTAPGGHRTLLRVDGSQLAEDWIMADLAPGERRTRSLVAGWHCGGAGDAVVVCADHLDQLGEADEANNCRQETWKCDVTPPTITSKPAVAALTSHSAGICWGTDEASDSLIRYDRWGGKYGGGVVQDESLGTYHCLELIGLAPSTTYRYQVQSTDASGNSVTGGVLHLKTGALPDSENPSLSLFLPDKLSGKAVITATAEDKVGVDRVTFFLDGKPTHTDFTSPFEWELQTTALDDGLYPFDARVVDKAGNEVDVGLFGDVQNHYPEHLSPVNVLIISPLSRSEVRGHVSIEAEVRHVDDEPISHLECWADGRLLLERDYRCRYFWRTRWCTGAVPLYETALWDATGLEIGSSHIISVTACDGSGNWGRAQIMVDIAAPEPEISVRRDVERMGNCFAVTLMVENAGEVDVDDIIVTDVNCGFQSLNSCHLSTGGDVFGPAIPCSSSYSTVVKSSRWQYQYGVALRAGNTLKIKYYAVPILFDLSEEPPWRSIGDPFAISYRAGDRSYTENPRTSWRTSSAPERAFADADYLILTNPWALYGHYDDAGVDELLATMAMLAKEKNGVLGYLPSGSSGSRSWVVKSLISPGGHWASKLGAGFDPVGVLDGYVLIVGETEIVSSFTADVSGLNIRWSGGGRTDEVKRSDNYYADTLGYDDAPDLVVGRIIGDSAGALLKPIQAALDVHGGQGFDKATALVASGYEDDSGNQFMNNAFNVAGDLADQGVSTRLLQWTNLAERVWTVHATDDDAFALGDVDGDGIDEVLIARDEEGRVYLYEPTGPSPITSFRVRFTQYDGFATGDLDGDGTDEIIIAVDDDGPHGMLYVYEPNGTLVHALDAEFENWDGLAAGDILGSGWAGGEWIEDRGRDEIVILSEGTRRMSIYRLDDHRTLRPGGSVFLDVEFTRHDGFAVGDVREYRDPAIDVEGWRRDEIVVIRNDDDQIYIYDADGTRVAQLRDLDGDQEVEFTRYDGFALGDVNEDGEDEMLVVCDDDDTISFYHWACWWDGGRGEWVDTVWKKSRMYSPYLDDWFDGIRYTASSSRHDGVAVGKVVSGDNPKVAILRNRDGDTSSFQVLASTWDDADEWANERVGQHAADISFIVASGHGSPWGPSPLFGDRAGSWGTLAQHPFVFALSCSTGEYDDHHPKYGDNSFGEALFDHGAAVFIGSTEVSAMTQNDHTIRGYFEDEWDVATTGAGLAFAEYERDRAGTGSDWWEFWVKEYNYYGDPKFGAVDGAGGGALTAQPPPSTLSVSVPMYQTDTVNGEHYVDIQGGDVLLEVGEPRVPFYRVQVEVPAGYQVQGVELTEKGGVLTAEGLNLPVVVAMTDSVRGGLNAPAPGIESWVKHQDAKASRHKDETFISLQPQSRNPLGDFVSSRPGVKPAGRPPEGGVAGGDEWYPAEDFEWRLVRNADGSSTLVVAVYAFWYNSLTTGVKFWQEYGFDIDCTASAVTVTHLATDKVAYAQGDDVGVDISIEGSDSPGDVVVDSGIRRHGSDEVVDGLLLRTLTDLASTASFWTEWDSSGFAPGDYVVDVTLQDDSGNVLDQVSTGFTLGVVAGEITQLSVTPEHFTVGDPITIRFDVGNTGTLNLSGTAVVNVQNGEGGSVREFQHEVTGLAPGQTEHVEDVWGTTGQQDGSYTIVTYLRYDSTTSAPVIVTVSAGVSAEERLYLPVVVRGA